jgi:alpha-L-rhamnosidase
MIHFQKYTFLLFNALIFSIPIQCSSPNQPFYLRCFNHSNPIGVDDRPFFGWYVSDNDQNEIQTAYQIIVATSKEDINKELGSIWNSDKVASRNQNYVYIPQHLLKAATQYYWKVRTWDKDNQVSPYSETASFSTGLFSNEDWSGAKWVKRPSEENETFTYFRKKTTTQNKEIKRAVAYISACHSYNLYINGTFIEKGFFHHYPQYSYYHALDITQHVLMGKELTFGVLTHWYGGGQGRATGYQGLLFKTIIEYQDGSFQYVYSDDTWRQTKAESWVTGTPRRNGEGIGFIETNDSRLVLNKWNQSDFNDKTWSPAYEVGSHPTAPWEGILRSDLTRVKEFEIKPVSIIPKGGGKYIIDLGKIYSGSFKIQFNGGKSGDTIAMRGGFVLDENGNVSTTLDQQTNMRFNHIHNGNQSEFYPYIYLGLRYLQIENSPSILDSNKVSFIFRYYELDPTQTRFSSSHATLNNVWEMMVHSLLIGTHEGFLDTPTREKGTFLGDSWAQGVPCLTVFNDRNMNLRALNEFLDSQDHYWPDGRMNAVYPNVDGKRDIPDYTQFFLFWAWDYYLQTGDKEWLLKNYSKLKKIADYVLRHKNESTGLIHNLAGGKGPYEYGIIDWPANMRYGYDMATQARTVINAYAFANFEIMSKIAFLTNHKEDGSKYSKSSIKIKKDMNLQLINKSGLYTDGLDSLLRQSEHTSQHANTIPYALDIVPTKEATVITEFIKSKNMSLGMICLRWLPEALGKAKEGEHLIDLYTNEDWDGWARTIALGGTVTWESWKANETNESMSHPWGAVGLLGIQNYILGIKTLTSQNHLISISPLWFGVKLTSAKGTYTTDSGIVEVDWSSKSNQYTIKIVVPANIKAKVNIPIQYGKTFYLNNKKVKGKKSGDVVFLGEYGSGTHTFTSYRKKG